MIKVGDNIKDYILKDQDNNDFNTAGLKGKKVLFSFHPMAFTSLCATQMKALEENYATFEELNTVPLGMSIDQQFAKGAWAKELGIERLRLLSDFWPTGQVAKDMDTFRKENGFSERAVVVADEEGKVIFSKQYPISELPDIDEILGFLKDRA